MSKVQRKGSRLPRSKPIKVQRVTGANLAATCAQTASEYSVPHSTWFTAVFKSIHCAGQRRLVWLPTSAIWKKNNPHRTPWNIKVSCRSQLRQILKMGMRLPDKIEILEQCRETLTIKASVTLAWSACTVLLTRSSDVNVIYGEAGIHAALLIPANDRPPAKTATSQHLSTVTNLPSTPKLPLIITPLIQTKAINSEKLQLRVLEQQNPTVSITLFKWSGHKNKLSHTQKLITK